MSNYGCGKRCIKSMQYYLLLSPWDEEDKIIMNILIKLCQICMKKDQTEPTIMCFLGDILVHPFAIFVAP